MDLTVRVVDRVKSTSLARFLRSIIVKLLNAMESPVRSLMRTVGMNLAYRLSEIGEELGCKSAVNWANDRNLIQFLTIVYMNIPGVYRAISEGKAE